MSNYANALMVVSTRNAVVYLFEGLLGLEVFLIVLVALFFGVFTWYTVAALGMVSFTFWRLIDYVHYTKEAWRYANKIIGGEQ